MVIFESLHFIFTINRLASFSFSVSVLPVFNYIRTQKTGRKTKSEKIWPLSLVHCVCAGAVTKVKNQLHGANSQCKSCWAFAAAGVLESYNKIKLGSLYNFSSQVTCF